MPSAGNGIGGILSGFVMEVMHVVMMVMLMTTEAGRCCHQIVTMTSSSLMATMSSQVIAVASPMKIGCRNVKMRLFGSPTLLMVMASRMSSTEAVTRWDVFHCLVALMTSIASSSGGRVDRAAASFQIARIILHSHA